MKKIAITGGIGSGKSTAIKYIEEMGYPVFSCDEIYKTIRQSAAYVKRISSEFPNAVVEGQIDSKKLSEIVFLDKSSLEKLNKISHPLIMEELLKAMNASNSTLVFAEVPLLFEGGFEKLFDKIIVITRNRDERIYAVQKRDGCTNEEVERRLSSQFDYDSEEGKRRVKAANAHLIENYGRKTELEEKLKTLIEKF